MNSSYNPSALEISNRFNGVSMAFFESAGMSDIGRKRKINEDSLYVDDALKLYIVADGMGGHRAGEVASQRIVKTISDCMANIPQECDPTDAAGESNGLSPMACQLHKALLQANRSVYQLAQKNKEYRGMGSTVSAVLLSSDRMVVANVGDSPVYCFRGDDIETLSVIHTVAAEQKAMAEDDSRMMSDEYSHVLTRAMGTHAQVRVDVSEMGYRAGDRVVICSDGLSDLVTTAEIGNAVSTMHVSAACQQLVRLANERGGPDNISVIVIKLLQDSECNGPSAIWKNPCRMVTLPVEYDTDDESYRGTIKGLTSQGGFIETNNAFATGQYLTLTFSVEDTTIMAAVRVVRRIPKGIFVSFVDVGKQEGALIDSLGKAQPAFAQ